MRYDTPVCFQRIVPGKYNPDTGDYGADTIREEKQYASVTNAGTETMHLVYGEIRQGCKAIRLQKPPKESFDRIRIGETIYSVDFARRLRSKQIYVASEVQHGRN